MRTILMVSLAFSCLCSAQVVPSSENTISVNGDAEVKVVPDRVLLSLGVETRDADLKRAKLQNDAGVRGVLEAARKLKVDGGEVQTDFMRVDISYKSGIGTVVDYYIVEKTIAITLRDVGRFEELLSAALTSGANHVYGVEFMTSQLRKYRDEARALAAKAAIEKANDLAAAAGLKVIGKPMGISTYSYGGGSWYGRFGGRGASMAQNVSQNYGSSPAAEGTLALGKISVTASVAMSFRLE